MSRTVPQAHFKMSCVVILPSVVMALTVYGTLPMVNARPASPSDIENRDPQEVQPEQEPNELVADGGKLPEERQSNELPSSATHQMRADMGALFPGLPQGSSGNPTLILGGFSLVTMPMLGMNDMIQNILPLLQKLPTPTQVFSG